MNEKKSTSADTSARSLVVQITTVPQTLHRLFPKVVAHLKAKGYEMKAITSPGTWVSASEVSEQLGIEVAEAPMSREVNPLGDLKAMFKLVSILRTWKPNLVHCHTPKGGMVGGLAGWLARVPVRVYTVRGLPHVTAKGLVRFLLLMGERVACATAHRIILVSPSVRDELVSLGIGNPKKMSVPGAGSAQGVDAEGRYNPERILAEQPAELRASLGLPDNAFVIGFVGRLTRDKGVKELVETWAAVKAQVPEAHLIVAGADKEPRGGMTPEQIAEFVADPRIHMLGNIHNVEEYFVHMDVFLFPSYREGFSNAVLEAAAMALPTVAFDVCGCRDGVIEGETGYLVPVHDAVAMQERVLTLYNDPALRKQMGDQARAWVLRDFRPEDRLRMLEEVYAELLKPSL